MLDCWMCRGRGAHYYSTGTYRCPVCKGKGKLGILATLAAIGLAIRYRGEDGGF